MKSIYIACLMLLVFTSCAVKVQTMQDDQVDFGKYKSFCWLKGCEFTFSGPRYLKEPLIQKYFQEAIIAEMDKKGIRYDNDTPDLLIDVHVTMQTDTVYAFHLPTETDMFMVSKMGDEEIIMLKGTLIIDLVDKETSRMVWRSVAVSYFESHPEATPRNFRKGVAKALKKFNAH